MKLQNFIVWLLSMFSFIESLGQYHYDSIRICHSKERKLSSIHAGGFEATFESSRLIELSTIDKSVRYQVNTETFTIKALDEGTNLSLQLAKDAPTLKYQDSSFALGPLAMVQGSPSNQPGVEEQLFLKGGVAFKLSVNQGRINKISFGVGIMSIIVGFPHFDNLSVWDFTVEITGNSKKLLLTHAHLGPFVLSIDDQANRVALRFLAKKNDGVFRNLEVLGIVGDNQYAANKFNQLKYSKTGKLRKKRTNLQLNCIK